MSRDALQRAADTILLVEDDDSVRLVLSQSMSKMGYRLLEAENGSIALDLLESGRSVDLVVTDVVMPVMGGFELAAQLARKHAGVKVLLISGYTQMDGGIAGNRVLADGTHFLRKPFSTEVLERKLREILAE